MTAGTAAHSHKHRLLIALGSNSTPLWSRLHNIEAAIAAINSEIGKVLQTSGLYETITAYVSNPQLPQSRLWGDQQKSWIETEQQLGFANDENSCVGSAVGGVHLNVTTKQEQQEKVDVRVGKSTNCSNATSAVPPHLNAAVLLESHIDNPEVVLEKLQSIERRFGRKQRSVTEAAANDKKGRNLSCFYYEQNTETPATSEKKFSSSLCSKETKTNVIKGAEKSNYYLNKSQESEKNISYNAENVIYSEMQVKTKHEVKPQCEKQNSTSFPPIVTAAAGDAIRPIDLDLLFYDDLVWKSEFLVLPHSRLHERNFVLYPIRDVQPGFTLPIASFSDSGASTAASTAAASTAAASTAAASSTDAAASDDAAAVDDAVAAVDAVAADADEFSKRSYHLSHKIAKVVDTTTDHTGNLQQQHHNDTKKPLCCLTPFRSVSVESRIRANIQKMKGYEDPLNSPLFPIFVVRPSLLWTFGPGYLPRLMGVLNVTPDSFSDGGLYNETDSAVSRAKQMIDEGADILDIGGESTAPGRNDVSIEQELRRIIPVIKEIRKFSNIPLSVDTRKSEVLIEAIKAGIDVLNDVSGGLHDAAVLDVAAKHKVSVILGHMRGSPKSMHKEAVYRNVIKEVAEELNARIKLAIAAGIPRWRIMVDVGLGFAKSGFDNMQLIRRLHVVAEKLPYGIGQCIGFSRKSFLNSIVKQQPLSAADSPGRDAPTCLESKEPLDVAARDSAGIALLSILTNQQLNEGLNFPIDQVDNESRSPRIALMRMHNVKHSKIALRVCSLYKFQRNPIN